MSKYFESLKDMTIVGIICFVALAFFFGWHHIAKRVLEVMALFLAHIYILRGIFCVKKTEIKY